MVDRRRPVGSVFSGRVGRRRGGRRSHVHGGHEIDVCQSLRPRFGSELTGVKHVREMVGSGSINYNVRANLKADGLPKKDAVIRIRRNSAIGQVQNELGRQILVENPTTLSMGCVV